MRGTISLLPQYAFMARFSVKKAYDELLAM
jgi:hypothetical protein